MKVLLGVLFSIVFLTACSVKNPALDLGKRCMVKGDQIVYQDTYDINYGYVLFDKHRKESIKVIHNFLKSLNIIPCGRYGLWAYLWSDEAILSGKKAAESL